jgi:hypothetical protein
MTLSTPSFVGMSCSANCLSIIYRGMQSLLLTVLMPRSTSHA